MCMIIYTHFQTAILKIRIIFNGNSIIGDHIRQRGDQTRQRGDQTRQRGDQTRQRGDQTRQRERLNG
jgi:hypothetical protein